MDDLERRNLVQAMKARARQVTEDRERRAQGEKRLMHVRFDVAKGMATKEHALKVLESRHVRQLTQIDNRPAEKLVKERTRGMAKAKKNKGPSGPGI